MNFFISLQLTKNDAEFLPISIMLKKVSKIFSAIEITAKKVCGNNVEFSTCENTPIKVCGKDLDFSTSKITLKKMHGNGVDFFNHQNYIEKVCGNDVEICQNLVFDVSR